MLTKENWQKFPDLYDQCFELFSLNSWVIFFCFLQKDKSLLLKVSSQRCQNLYKVDQISAFHLVPSNVQKVTSWVLGIGQRVHVELRQFQGQLFEKFSWPHYLHKCADTVLPSFIAISMYLKLGNHEQKISHLLLSKDHSNTLYESLYKF